MLKAQVQATSPRSFRTKKRRSSNYKVLSTSVEWLTYLCSLHTEITHKSDNQRESNWNPTNHFPSSVHRRGMSRQGTNHQQTQSSDHPGHHRVLVDRNSNPSPRGSNPYAGFPSEHSRSPDSEYLYRQLGSSDGNDPPFPGVTGAAEVDDPSGSIVEILITDLVGSIGGSG